MTNRIQSFIASMALVAFVVASSPSVFAAPVKTAAVAGQSGKTVSVPEHAVEKAPGLYYLGESYDVDSDSMVEGYMIVHPRDAHAKPSGAGNSKGKPGSGSATASCYGFIAKGAKWKTVEPWVVDPSNPEGLDELGVFNTLKAGINKWEDAADGVVDGNEVTNIFGTAYSLVSPVVQADTVATDGTNEVHFGDLDPGTIGVTIVWGRFGGPVSNREIVEWDQVYNTDYAWSLTGASNAMDFESIATHELGHAFGLADLYDANCVDMTMFGYGSNGDTKARTLEDGDINGMNTLY